MVSDWDPGVATRSITITLERFDYRTDRFCRKLAIRETLPYLQGTDHRLVKCREVGQASFGFLAACFSINVRTRGQADLPLSVVVRMRI